MFFFFNDTATTEIYTLSLHDALPIYVLDYLHNRRPPIIYRDLKPANLMIDGNSSRVMLIDFGIARWVSPQEKGVTAVGRSEEHTSELQSRQYLVCRLLLEKKKPKRMR